MSTIPSWLEGCAAAGSPLLMGVLNVTPDSFSDGGLFQDEGRAFARIDELIEHGARVIDIGGESTRPHFMPVSSQEQIARTGSSIRYAADRGIAVSIDTTKPDVAQAAIDLGASIVNDVSCLSDSDELARVVARCGASLILMHSRAPMSVSSGYSGTPENAYEDVVRDVIGEWVSAQERAERAGVPRSRTLLDPGLGFNKTARHCAEIVRRLRDFVALGFPVVVGPSRKSFLVADVRSEPLQRVGGTVAACLACARQGVAGLRVHDVLQVRQALAVAQAVGLLDDARGSVPHA